MFIRLGIVNSLRQIGRSLLVLMAMVLAAMSLTSGLSFGQGEMNNSYQFYRGLIGGEILVAPVRWAGQQVDDATGNTALEYQRLQKTGLSWLEAYYPELYDQGFLSNPAFTQTQHFQRKDLEALAKQPGINGASVHPWFIAEARNQSLNSDKLVSLTVMPLPELSRITDDSNQVVQQYLRESGAPVILINSHMNVPDNLLEQVAQTIRDDEVSSPFEEVQPTPDEIYQRKLTAARRRILEELYLPKDKDIAEVTVPRYQFSDTIGYVPDFSAAKVYELQMKSGMRIPTRTLMWMGPMGPLSETLFLHGAYAWVPQDMWNRMWEDASGGSEHPMYNVSLQVEDMSQLEITTMQLRKQFPQFTFVSVADLAGRLEGAGLLEKAYRAPSYVFNPDSSGGLALPVSLGPVMGMLFYLIAGMLIASRMLTGAAARRLEVGVLKALGARKRDVVVMALTETMLVTIIGTSIGFVLVRMGGVAMEISNGSPWSAILAGTVAEYLLVLGVASLTSLFFALMPAVRMANLTVMGVLRGE